MGRIVSAHCSPVTVAASGSLPSNKLISSAGKYYTESQYGKSVLEGSRGGQFR